MPTTRSQMKRVEQQTDQQSAKRAQLLERQRRMASASKTTFFRTLKHAQPPRNSEERDDASDPATQQNNDQQGPETSVTIDMDLDSTSGGASNMTPAREPGNDINQGGARQKTQTPASNNLANIKQDQETNQQKLRSPPQQQHNPPPTALQHNTLRPTMSTPPTASTQQTHATNYYPLQPHQQQESQRIYNTPLSSHHVPAPTQRQLQLQFIPASNNHPSPQDNQQLSTVQHNLERQTQTANQHDAMLNPPPVPYTAQNT